MEPLEFLIKKRESECRQHFIPKNHIDPTFIPVFLSGGVGDVIMAIDALNELEKKYQILRYSQHIEAFAYFSDKIVIKEMPLYTWYLDINSVCRFKFSELFSDFLLKEHRELFEKQIDLFKSDPKLSYLCTKHPDEDFQLCRYARDLGLDRRSLILYSLGLS